MNTVENINNYNYPSKNFFPAKISSISAWMRVVREADKQSDYQFTACVNKAGSIAFKDSSKITFSFLVTLVVKMKININLWARLEKIIDDEKLKCTIWQLYDNYRIKVSPEYNQELRYIRANLFG